MFLKLIGRSNTLSGATSNEMFNEFTLFSESVDDVADVADVVAINLAIARVTTISFDKLIEND